MANFSMYLQMSEDNSNKKATITSSSTTVTNASTTSTAKATATKAATTVKTSLFPL